MKPSIVLDTNCASRKHIIKEVANLLQMHDKGIIEIIKTHELGKEIPTKYLKNYTIEEDVDKRGFVEYTTTDNAVIASDYDEQIFNGIWQLIFTRKKLEINDFVDLWNLMTAKLYNRTYFVTLDGRLLDKKEQLKNQYAISILNPSECLLALSNNFHIKN